MAADRVRISLRYKLLFILTLLPLVSLSLYLFMATRLFEKDKVAYVFDSSVAVAHSLAVQTRKEIESMVSRVKPVLESFDVQNKKFADVTIDYFSKQEDIDRLLILQVQQNQYVVLGQLVRGNQQPVGLTPDLVRIAQKTFATGINLVPIDDAGQFYFSQRLGDAKDPNAVLHISVMHSKDLIAAFGEAGIYKSYLVNQSSQILLGPTSDEGSAADVSSETFGPYLSGKTPEGTAEVQADGQQEILMSFSRVQLGDLTVFSTIRKADALQAVQILVRKSLIFFIALLASTVVISLLASAQLTSALRELFVATQKVARGDFDVHVRTTSEDEIGGLADSFNLMAKEVSRLLSETAEKARMANELATVRTVQETLFPEPHKQFGAFEVVGHFEPASECGGDWWNYCLIGDKLFCWIGDATGHGAPAALITGAARSAASIIEMMPNMTPAKALQIMNRAIGETSKSRILMTFFIMMVDLKTGVLTYSTASHDPPFLMRKPQGRKIGKKDLIPLMDKVGPRLGDQPRAVYQDVVVQLEPGDLVLMYTDGIIDLKNPAGDTWGERTFIKNAIASFEGAQTANERMQSLKAQIQDFRKEAQLLDDVTLVMCQYQTSTQNEGQTAA